MRKAVWILVVGLVIASPAGAHDGRAAEVEAMSGLHTLVYVEASTGLIPPTLDGGLTEIEMGDVNGDGAIDFAVGHQDATVYLGDGEGDFIPADGNLPAGDAQGRAGIALGDVNRDGADDLSFCNLSGGIEVWTWMGASM